MTECPSSWVEIELIEVADLIRGVSYKKERSTASPQEGFLPVLRATNITGMSLTFDGLVYVPADNVSAEQLLRPGDVVIASSSGSKEIVGKAGTFEREGFVGSFGAFCTGLRPAGSLSARYFSYYFQTPSYRKAVSELSAGSNINNLKTGDLASQSFPIPPLQEQTRIVAKLEELLSDLDAGVAELKAAQKKLTQYRQSLLKAAVEGALTAEWRASLPPLSPSGRGAGGEGPWLTQRAKTLRREQTPAEQSLWQHLRAKRFSGYKFRRQQPIGRYVVDFVCFARKLVVELDGSQHAERVAYDQERDAWLRSQGFRVLRFWNNEWTGQREAVLEGIWRGLEEDPPGPSPGPSPLTPLPRGERGTRGEGLERETGEELLRRILVERRVRWEEKQLARFNELGKAPPQGWQQKYPEPVAPDFSGLPELPEGWVWASVDQLCESVRNGISKTPNSDRAGFPIFKINAVRPMAVNFTAIKHIEISEAEAAGYWVEVGDVLATRYNGSVDLLGVFALVKEVLQPTLHPDKLIRMKPIAGVSAGAWMEVCGNVGVSREHLVSRVKTTAGQTGISGDDLKKTPIPLPPVVEQELAIDVLNERLAGIQMLEKSVDLALKQSTAQRQNILRAAFSGELVAQDPNDEPASALLERIRAERAARAGDKKARGRSARKVV